jgi:ABC-type proline/glycine betaine transport system permease subunit
LGFTGRGPRFGSSIVVVVSSGEWRQTRIAVATTAVAAVVTFVIGIATGLRILR